MIVHQLPINPEYIKVRWQEPYVSGGLNRKTFGVIPTGIYHGFSIEAGPGNREVTVTTDDPFGDSGSVSGHSGGNYDAAGGYSIAVINDRRGMQTTVNMDSGVSGTFTFDATGYDDTDLYAVIKARYYIGQWSDGWVALVTADEIDDNPEYVVIGKVAVPSSGTPIDSSHISYRDDTDYPRTEPFATWYKWGFMHSDYVRKVDAIEELMYRKLTGGGFIEFDANLLEWSSQIRVYIPGRNDVYYIDPGSQTFDSNGQVLYTVIPHEEPTTALPTYFGTIDTITTESVSGVAVPIFIRAFNRVYSGDGGTLQLVQGDAVSGGIDTDLPANIESLLGITDTSTEWGFTNNFPGSQFQNAVERWSSLSEDDENLHEDRNVLLSCSGNVSWDLSNETLDIGDPFVLTVPNESFDWYVNSGSVSGISDGDILYVTVNRSAQAWLNFSKTSNGSLPLDASNKNHYAIAYRLGDRIVFRNGYVLQDGANTPFENLIDRDVHIRWDSVMNRVLAVGNISNIDGSSGQVQWDYPIKIRSLAGNLYYEVASGSVTLADEYVGYLDLDRDTDIGPHLLWVNGSDTLASVGSVSWTGSLSAGDWVKKKLLGYSKYYKIASVDNAWTVTLDENVAEDSSPVTGEKSQYALANPTLQTAHRQYVPEDAFWLFYRDDLGSPRTRIHVRDIGQILEGDMITPIAWVYNEDLLTTEVSGIGSLMTLPNDSRDGDAPKYYRVGIGDMLVFANGVLLTSDRVDVTTQFMLDSYNSTTGECFVNASYNASLVRPGDWFTDALGRTNLVKSKPTGTNSFKVAPGSLVDTGFGGFVYRHDYDEVGVTNSLSNQIELLRPFPAGVTFKFWIQPFSRPYAESSGTGVSGDVGGGGGAGTLQEAYDGGHVVNVAEGRPVTFNGAGISGKTFRVLGHMEVSGVVDPTGVTYDEVSSDPDPGKNTQWMNLGGDLIQQDTIRGITHILTEQGKWKQSYQNTTGSVLNSGRIVVKDGSGKVKYASRDTELNSNVIGVLMQNIAHTATGFVQRSGWIESSIFTTSCFTEGSFPSEGVAVWLATNGQMTVTGPATGSGERAIKVGIWDEGGLLWQIRDYGTA